MAAGDDDLHQLPAHRERKLTTEIEILAEAHDADVLQPVDERAGSQHQHDRREARLVVKGRCRKCGQAQQHGQHAAEQLVQGPGAVEILAARRLILDECNVEAEARKQVERGNHRRAERDEPEIGRHEKSREYHSAGKAECRHRKPQRHHPDGALRHAAFDMCRHKGWR